VKVTIYADPDDFILAVRAAKSMLDHPNAKTIIVAFEDGSDFLVKRNKAGLTVSEAHRAAPSNPADKGRLGG
jgi:hypothetical protein